MSVDFIADETNILGKEQIDKMFAGIDERLQMRKELLAAGMPEGIDKDSKAGTLYSAYLEYIASKGGKLE